MPRRKFLGLTDTFSQQLPEVVHHGADARTGQPAGHDASHPPPPAHRGVKTGSTAFYDNRMKKPATVDFPSTVPIAFCSTT